MCGIAGIVTRDGRVEHATLAAMRDALRHRGPDAEGLWLAEDRRAGLAHRRLAIIDLSAAADQPMVAADGRHVLVFNGEIYNYRELARELEHAGQRFLTSSDTEVLLAAYRQWGDDCVDRLEGMFAFAVWDTVDRVLVLARDRAGEKPLHYRARDGVLSFASELKGLLAEPGAPRRLDAAAFDCYLAYGAVAHSASILAGYAKLPPGHLLRYEAERGRLRIRPFWTLPASSSPAGDPGELAGRLEELLDAAVRRQLVADVPVGVLLSGGIDSSLVTAMAARRASAPVKTFNVSFRGHAGFDEAPYARLVARHFGTEHHELGAEPAGVAVLPEVAACFDEPLGDHAVVPMFQLARLVAGEVKVALGGDGGDEVFGGYPHHSFLQRGQRMRRVFPAGVRGLVGTAAARLMPPGARGRNHLAGLGGRGTSHVNIFFDAAWRRRLRGPAVAAGLDPVSPEERRAAVAADEDDILRAACATDFLTTLPDTYLVKVDRAAMAHSLEVRAPLLDRALVEFGFAAVPSHLRATARRTKILPKLLARRILPVGLELERKQGFTMPLGAWFAGGDWGPYLRSVLAGLPPEIVAPHEVARLVGHQRRGRPNTQRIFALAMFELWRRHYRVELP